MQQTLMTLEPAFATLTELWPLRFQGQVKGRPVKIDCRDGHFAKQIRDARVALFLALGSVSVRLAEVHFRHGDVSPAQFFLVLPGLCHSAKAAGELSAALVGTTSKLNTGAAPAVRTRSTLTGLVS